MNETAIAHFDVTSWEEAAYDESPGGPRLSRANVTKQFRGDLDGESTAVVLMCQADPQDLEAGGGFVGSERVVGQLNGRDGTFVMQHGGVAGGGQERRTFGHVVPGSGTGALAGLAGTLELSIDAEGRHTLTMQYTIPD